MNTEINEQAKRSLERYPSIDLRDETFTLVKSTKSGNKLLYKILQSEDYYYVIKMEVLAISDDLTQANSFLGYFVNNRG